MSSDVLWDRFSGCLAEYVDNYLLKTRGGGKFGIKPSYEVDYEISNPDSLFDDTSFDGYWVHKVARCRNINDLEPGLKELAIQFLPKFFTQFPEYRTEECLNVKSDGN
ncbi:hypothetical protein [Oscillibacter sp. PC13]|uniref:hypothetical protein n=1 Tax=Oscillibacter sp. PC13 TaxID=1855299 RepID=UPI0011602525|nr:hypothetical protein [Oscillibacter sp. PC13]